MFHLGRRRLLRRLLRAARGGAEPGALLERLTEPQLRALAAGAGGACVPPPAAGAALAACRAWRWPERDLRAHELRALPDCRLRACCNPWHWSRLCKPETPPPPYCRTPMDDKLKPEDRAPSEDSRRTDHERLQPESLTTDGEDKLDGVVWCQLAYWELGARVGRLQPVEAAALRVHGAAPGGGAPAGLSLRLLAEHAEHAAHAAHAELASSDSVLRTRAKIGLGVTLSMEADGVWVYNLSEHPVFVNSPSLDDSETRSLLVYRVPSGHCLCVFRPRPLARPPRPQRPPRPPTGPVDPNSVRISFAKGWGPKYSRQEVTACPCWLEILLSPCR